MGNQPKKKRHHYVPRLILRKFSKDERRINLLVLETGKVVQNASLKEQCYRDYFYGTDDGIENAFGETEGEFARILGDLGAERLEKIVELEVLRICHFVHYQYMRTLARAEYADLFHDRLAKAVLSKDSRFGELNLSEVKIGLGNPQLESLEHAAALTPLLWDLEVKFLVSDRKIGFVLSDDPVASYNQFAEHHPLFCHWSGTWGLGLKGLQMFLPVSPRVCVAVYDPSTYVYGSPKKRVCKISLHDVKFLNTLQVLNSHKCLYYHPECTPSEELERLVRERKQRGDWRSPLIHEQAPVRDAEGRASQLIVYNSPEIRLGSQFNFSQVIDRNPYEGYDLGCIPIRSPELAALSRYFGKFLSKEIEKKRKSRGADAAGVNGPGDVTGKSSGVQG